MDTDARASLDGAAGRQASKGALQRTLPTAPAEFLDGALRNPALGNDEMRLLLRNYRVGAATLAQIGRDARWVGQGEVRRLLVQHPHVPLTIARNLLGHLSWKDLLEVSVNLRVHPFVRRQAERTLELRVERMSTGERISLARRATRGVIGQLVVDDDPRVARALLDNPRLIEKNAVAIAVSPRSRPATLASLAQHAAWGQRPAVRAGLLRNPRTPVAVALKTVAALPRSSL
ncbi:MAG TPA: hypothetical protein VD788_13055, partial [Candidatus Polarisedimenticolaceae bacterium]|nr:hypothetical protein [Candidatus Polarisedimenticolaceae bacterium]